MELKQYFYLFRRWAWLLVLGLVLGTAGAYGYSLTQPLVFQTSTKVMVMRSLEDRRTEYTTLNDFQLITTYSQLIKTDPVLQRASAELGYPVSSGAITARAISDSLLMEIIVKDGNANRAAEIANSLVVVFIDYNDELQTSRYTASEESLLAQIDQVQAQIAGIQVQMAEVSQETLKSQQQQAEERLQALDAEIASLEDELKAFVVTPAPTAEAGAEPTATPTSGELALLSARDDLHKEKQTRLTELKSIRALYQQVYLNLLVFGETSSKSDGSLRQSQLSATLALYQQIYSNLLNNYENVRLSRLRGTSSVVQIENARVPHSPIQPQPMRNALLGGLVGLILMAAIAFLIEYLDDTIKTPEDVGAALGLPVIGLIGEMERLKNKEAYVYVADNPRSPISEAFRSLRTNIDFAGVDKPIRSLLITSSSPSEGKTTVCVNLAAVMAQGDRKVILVDGDLRRPNVHRHLKIPNRLGLTALFRTHTREQITVEQAMADWGEPGFKVTPSGALPPNPTELLGSERMSQLIEEWKGASDIVIIDAPPCIIADPVVLSSKVDGVLVVIEPGRTKIEAAQAMLEQLQRAGARVVGVVLNPITRKRAGYYSGRYRYYSEYYYSRSYSQYTGENGSGRIRELEKKNGREPIKVSELDQ
jgi:polysaccharide biosynthesis transport protein